jgi:hypothetical protein
MKGTHSPVDEQSKNTGASVCRRFGCSMFYKLWVYKKTELVDTYCKKWHLKCNLNRAEIMIFQRGGKLKSTEKWRMNGQNTEVVYKVNYTGVTWGSKEGWNQQTTLAKIKGYEDIKMFYIYIYIYIYECNHICNNYKSIHFNHHDPLKMVV